MRKFNNPLNNIKIASPCAADWDKMYGNERQRHCSDCKLNVYNLSEMTQIEAENFLINAEGRVCVKFYRRTDGTVLTKDCPVGWRKLKKRMSLTTKAIFASALGLFTGIFSYNQTQIDYNSLMNQVSVETEKSTDVLSVPVLGEIAPPNKIKEKAKKKNVKKNQMVLGRVETIRQLKDEPVVLWIE